MTTRAQAIQICGTGSGVGKSIIVAGLCRLFRQDGFAVVPFKAQNMALNAYVTKDGGEIGRAQAVQACAAGVEPSVDMNPILIKPVADTTAEVILSGRPIGNMDVLEYVSYKRRALTAVHRAYDRIAAQADIVVIEGAGSPAEVNLRSHDIVNMRMAAYADAPVIVVGDIDKGGVFAWLWGTLDLLTPAERRRVRGWIINKFRGDRALLDPGLRFLERKTGKKVLGVLPYVSDLGIAEEDAPAMFSPPVRPDAAVRIGIVPLPHVANFTDFDPFKRERDVVIAFLRDPAAIASCDVVIVPGTKSTINDRRWMAARGWDGALLRARQQGATIVGICGGFQILGRSIRDPHHIESSALAAAGLGLLNVETVLARHKETAQVRAVAQTFSATVDGYEIHRGVTRRGSGVRPFFTITRRGTRAVQIADGGCNRDGTVWGTYIHGLFDHADLRRSFINTVRARKGLDPLPRAEDDTDDGAFDRLADLLRRHLDVQRLYAIIGERGWTRKTGAVQGSASGARCR